MFVGCGCCELTGSVVTLWARWQHPLRHAQLHRPGDPGQEGTQLRGGRLVDRLHPVSTPVLPLCDVRTYYTTP